MDNYEMSDELEAVVQEEEAVTNDDVSSDSRGEGLAGLKDFDSVFEAIKEDDTGKFDVQVELKDIGFFVEPNQGKKDDFRRFFLTLPQGIFSDVDVSRVEFDTQGKALRQFFSVVNAPKDFGWMLNEVHSGLADRIVDEMRMERNNRRLLLRLRKPGTGPGGKKDCKHPYVRAILNQAYGRLDNVDYAADIEEQVNKYGLKVQSLNITDHGFHCRLVDPKRQLPIGSMKDDNITRGVAISNSETGHFRVTADYLLYRVVCSNGMISLIDGQNMFSQHHTRIDRPAFRGRVEEGFFKFDNSLPRVLEGFAKLQTLKLKDPYATMDEMFRNERVSNSHRELIKHTLRSYEKTESWFNTRFAVVNAITEASQKVADQFDRRKLDEMAGKVAASYARQYN